MKQWKINFVLLIGALLCLSLLAVSCNQAKDIHNDAIEEVDSSTMCANALMETMYASPSDFQVTQVNLQSQETIKRIFLEMSPQMIDRVARVVLSKNNTATIEDLVTEYKINYDIYSRQIDKNEAIPKKNAVESFTPSDTSNTKITKDEQTSISATLLWR